MAGHFLRCRAEDSPRINPKYPKVLFWQPAHGKKSVGGQRKTFVDRLASDTGLGVGDMKTAMKDRKG